MKKLLSMVSILLCFSVLTACGSSVSDNSETSNQLETINEKLNELETQVNSLNEENNTLKKDNESLKSNNESLSQELDRKTIEAVSKAKEEESSKVAVESEVKAKEDVKEEIKEIKIGETVSDKSFDFTLKNVTLTYKAEPDTKPILYTYYEAKPGKVYIKVDAVIKNTGKVGLDCDEIYTVTADYNNGYPYSGFAVADDHDGDFTYASITRIDPLETLGVHYLIDCPDEVDTNTSAPLTLEITLNDGSKYSYKIR